MSQVFCYTYQSNLKQVILFELGRMKQVPSVHCVYSSLTELSYISQSHRRIMRSIIHLPGGTKSGSYMRLLEKTIPPLDS